MFDDVKVQVAMIGCASAIGVAFVSVLTNIIVVRSTYRTARVLEQLKQSSGQDREKRLISDDQLKTTIDAFRQALTAVQYYKDRIQLVLSERVTPLDAESAMEMLIGGRALLMETYASTHPDLTQEGADELHGAKSIAVLVTSQGCDFLSDKTDVAYLPNELRALFCSARADLSDIQLRLRENMNHKMMARMFQ